jgi:hypothetical protein
METEEQQMRRPVFVPVITVAVSLAAALAVGGCGHPLIPASALRPAASSAATAGQHRTRPDAAGKPVLGVDLYALSNYPAAEVRTDGQRTLAYIKNVLKATAVGIVWDFFAASDRANRVLATGATLSPASVSMLTTMAQQDHLQVEYRPLIFVGTPAQHGWEGKISPADPALWFSRYYQAELPYLKIAKRQHVREFVVATEMHALNRSPLWRSFLRRVGQAYPGVVSYTAWDQDYFPPHTHLLPARSLGMDMYAPVHLPASASSRRVTQAWEKMFAAVPAPVLRRTAIDEIGIEARSGAYLDPPNLGAPGKLDEQVQANWFTAACATVHKFHLRGVFFWKVDLTDNPVVHPATSLSTFEGKKGAVAISDCTRILY